MLISLEEFLDNSLEEFKSNLKTYDDWIDIQEKISNFKYPNRIWTSDFKKEIKNLWKDKQEEHQERVIKLYTEILIEYYNENKTTII